MTIFIPFRVFVWRPPVVFLLLLFLPVSLLVPRNHRSVRGHARAPLLPLALSFSPPQVYYPRVRGAKNTESPKTDVKIALGVTESAGSVGESRLKKGYSQVMARAPAGGSVGEPSFFSPHAPTIDHEMPARWSKPKKWKINICAFSCPPLPLARSSFLSSYRRAIPRRRCRSSRFRTNSPWIFSRCWRGECYYRCTQY